MKTALRAIALGLALIGSVGNAGAVDLSTNAIVELVQGITITEDTPLNFGTLAINNGTVTISTATVSGPPAADPNSLTVDGTNQTRGEFTIDSVNGASVAIDITVGAAANGLTLTGTTIEIDASGEVAPPLAGHSLGAAITTLYVGGTLDVEADNATIAVGAGQMIPYTVTVAFD